MQTVAKLRFGGGAGWRGRRELTADSLAAGQGVGEACTAASAYLRYGVTESRRNMRGWAASMGWVER